MKHIKKFNSKQSLKSKQPLKYKEGDIVGYDKYLTQPSIPVVILKATESSPFPYFVEEIKKPYIHSLSREEIVDLTPEQKDEIELYLNIQKYNI
jgi:hypothetical protein